MPQALLPLIPAGATMISQRISVIRREGTWTYYCGIQPVFQHAEEDRTSFQMFIAQLCVQGACTQAQIIRHFGVSKNSVLRSVAKFRQKGVGSFYGRRCGRGPTVMSAEVIAQVQDRIDRGSTLKEVVQDLNLKYDTVRKVIRKLRPVKEPQGKETVGQGGKETEGKDTGGETEGGKAAEAASDKSSRSEADAAAGEQMGIGCTRPEERVLAAVGKLAEGASTRFAPSRDVSYGGVLCALPALGYNGLLKFLEKLPGLSGYYQKVHIVLLLGYMALCRIKTVERLQGESPGELGKLLGLDRIPEVRCLRQKMSELSAQAKPQEWAAQLAQYWMEEDEHLAGTLYIDGHVRLYHGSKTKLPRRYVARQRLCLRGTTDYWVNDVLGQPFFSVERTVDAGLLEVLRNEIVPRLLREVPGQPTEEQLEADRYLHRLVMVFDREGYSPSFFREMWEKHRIACITYHKYPRDVWPVEWFEETVGVLPDGEKVTLKLAERGTWIGGCPEGLWVREVRKLTQSGHQTSLISTVYGQSAWDNAIYLFSRWSQENFFRYMMQNFSIDALNEYSTEKMDGTVPPVVNPVWREWDGKCRSLKSKLTKRQAHFASLTLQEQPEEGKALLAWQQKKGAVREEIEQLEHELAELKAQAAQMPKHVKWADLPEEKQFERLAPSRKCLTDTIKLVAYRAETALAMIVKEKLTNPEEARSVIASLLRSDADFYPDETEKVLRIHLHTMANPRLNQAVQYLLDHLNEANFIYPGTDFQLVFTMAASPQKQNLVPS